MIFMRAIALLSALFLAAGADEKRVPRKQADGSYLLPNGWALSPAGRHVELGGLPLKLLRIPQSRYAVAASNGYREHFLAVIDLEAQKVTQRVAIEEGWMGLAASPDGSVVYASAGGQDRILVYRFSAGLLTYDHDISLSVRAFPAGLCVNGKGDRLYVAANGDHTLKVVDPKKRRVLNVIPVGAKPYTCQLSRDERFVYVSNWGEDTIAIVGLRENNVFRTIKVREKPNDLALDTKANRLFVANGNRNSVSIIDTNSLSVREEIDVALTPNSLPGSTPNALALSTDARTLYVANADNNSLAVIMCRVPVKVPQGASSLPAGIRPR